MEALLDLSRPTDVVLLDGVVSAFMDARNPNVSHQSFCRIISLSSLPYLLLSSKLTFLLSSTLHHHHHYYRENKLNKFSQHFRTIQMLGPVWIKSWKRASREKLNSWR